MEILQGLQGRCPKIIRMPRSHLLILKTLTRVFDSQNTLRNGLPPQWSRVTQRAFSALFLILFLTLVDAQNVQEAKTPGTENFPKGPLWRVCTLYWSRPRFYPVCPRR